MRFVFKFGILATVLAVVLHFQKDVDFWLQHFFYPDSTWWIPSNSALLHTLFYEIPRTLPWIAGVLILVLAVIRYRKIKKLEARWIQSLVFLSLLPVLIGGLKAVTGQACPNAFQSFGGILADSVLYFKGQRCFPGGHVSAGFALLGVCFLIFSVQRRVWVVALILIWSLVIGFYQMGRGVHFTSDTLATLGLAALLYAVVSRLFPASSSPI